MFGKWLLCVPAHEIDSLVMQLVKVLVSVGYICSYSIRSYECRGTHVPDQPIVFDLIRSVLISIICCVNLLACIQSSSGPRGESLHASDVVAAW